MTIRFYRSVINGWELGQPTWNLSQDRQIPNLHSQYFIRSLLLFLEKVNFSITIWDELVNRLNEFKNDKQTEKVIYGKKKKLHLLYLCPIDMNGWVMADYNFTLRVINF